MKRTLWKAAIYCGVGLAFGSFDYFALIGSFDHVAIKSSDADGNAPGDGKDDEKSQTGGGGNKRVESPREDGIKGNHEEKLPAGQGAAFGNGGSLPELAPNSGPSDGDGRLPES
jgi:hypothetical protein